MSRNGTRQPEPADNRPVIRIERVIALWALSEAALGGVLHAFRIPFTGLIINSTAVVFMVLIATASQKRGTILQATVIVLIIKGLVSPHTPLAAYFAVAFQGLLGEVLLRPKRYLLLSSLVLGVVTLFQSAIQKILILTLLYGQALWESIDVFVNLLVNQFSFLLPVTNHINYSLWLISFYLGIHLLAGVGIGLVAARVPKWLYLELQKSDDSRLRIIPPSAEPITQHKRKRGIKKPSLLIIILLAASLFISSYLFPEVSRTQGMKALIMILRAVFILILWYLLIGPQLFKLYQRWARNKTNQYASQVQGAIDIFPSLRYIIRQTWQKSKEFHGVQRMKIFIVHSLASILTMEI